MKQIKQKGMALSALLIAMLMAIVALAVPMSTANQAAALPVVGDKIFSNEVNTDELNVGDIVAEGIRGTNSTCDFGALKVHTTAPSDGITRWVGLKVDPQCRAVLNAKWNGSLKEGPQDVIEPLLKVLPNMTQQVSEKNQPAVASQDEVSALSAPKATKTSEQHIYMYGFGGPLDKLTHKYGSLTFSYNGQSATISSQSGSCAGSKPFWWYEWKVDACYLKDITSGPSNQVLRSGQGDYHCDPATTSPCTLSDPDGYYHSLIDEEVGYADGRSSCNYWRPGNIVFGTGQEILQGCS